MSYARALADLEELRSDAAALAMAANGGSLLDRVARLTARRRVSRCPRLRAVLRPAWRRRRRLVAAAGAGNPAAAGSAVSYRVDRVRLRTRRRRPTFAPAERSPAGRGAAQPSRWT